MKYRLLQQQSQGFPGQLKQQSYSLTVPFPLHPSQVSPPEVRLGFTYASSLECAAIPASVVIKP